MATVIKLAKARKQQRRAVEAVKAAKNRVLNGRTKAEALRDKAALERAARVLDQARQEP